MIPPTSRFYVYHPRSLRCIVRWFEYEDGWRDDWAPEGDDKAGESFGSPVARHKGEENVPTEWWVIKD